jgi:hypothetical protein
MQKLTHHFTVILIGLLITIIILQRSCTDPKVVTPEPSVVTKIDTIWKHVYHTTIKKVPVKSYIYYEPEIVRVTPSDNIDTCKAKFNTLFKKHSIQTIYQDTLKLDSLGTVTIIDTVWLNKLGKRVYIQNIKIPIVTKTTTITKQKPAVRQLYIGGNLFGDKTKLQLLTPGILYKTKSDHIYQANLGVNFDGTFTYGLGAYWKLSFKK